MSISQLAKEHQDMILDGTKINYYHDRVRAWERGERIAPITIDMALTRTCNYKCVYCYATLQENKGIYKIKQEHMRPFLDDCEEIGVKGVSLVSDGESSINPCFIDTIQYGYSKGLSMASGSNAFLMNEKMLKEIMPCLTYLRINITAGEEKRYQDIMGVGQGKFSQVCENIKTMMRLKKQNGWKCSVGTQMVLMPEFVDQVLPLAKLSVDLGVDYLVIKHCSDDENGSLGVNYGAYRGLYDVLKQAEEMSTVQTVVKVKWSKIEDGNIRSYKKCYGPPFLLQLSGTGLIAPCGMLFNDKYKRYHMGNITEQRFKEVWQSEKYWEVMRHLASDAFDAQTMCGSLCLQHSVNKYLDNYKKGKIELVEPVGDKPEHVEFV